MLGSCIFNPKLSSRKNLGDQNAFQISYTFRIFEFSVLLLIDNQVYRNQYRKSWFQFNGKVMLIELLRYSLFLIRAVFSWRFVTDSAFFKLWMATRYYCLKRTFFCTFLFFFFFFFFLIVARQDGDTTGEISYLISFFLRATIKKKKKTKKKRNVQKNVRFRQ